ncbi:MAG: penicillin-binding transpeptidase domain-containing protein [Bacilli bacterium]|nr:penicillin-binding transpeptidase domain-containing protein [Bacilli bacterium]
MKIYRKRILVIYIIMLIAFLSIICKLTYVKIIKSNEYYNLAIDLWTRSAPIKGARGNIYDRNGKLIVGTYLTPTVVAIPKQITNKDKTASIIADILKCDKEKILKHLTKNVSVEILKPEAQKISVEDSLKISDENLRGIYVVGDTTRYYPYEHVLSQVVGITGIDSQGLTGIEAMYDEYLQGESGALQIFTDAHGDEIFNLSSLYEKATPGSDVYLTIDLDVQLTLERVLDNAMVKYNAKEMSGIALNPKTGEVIAMASRPTYNPSHYQDYSSELYNRNIPIWKCYEPGSTFKICSFAMGLEEEVFKLDDPFYDPGYAIVDGARLRDWKRGGHGKETYLEVLQNSCNPGFVSIGLKLGKERFFKYLRAFGFGEKTGIDLVGESKGIIFNEEKIGNVELATSAFGQGNSVTMIQLVTGASAAVNGGNLMTPYILKKIVNSDKELVVKNPVVKRQVISEKTSNLMRESLESVVAKGTGRGGYAEGIRLMGKTGTAQKAENGRYIPGKYILSFLGIAPADDPSIALMITVDEPVNTIQYGGVVVAPMVKEVIVESFTILNIEKRKDGIPLVPRYWIDKKIYTVDDYVGMSVGKVRPTENYKFIVYGNGLTVRAQVPEAGEKIIEGGYVILYT